MIIAKYTLSEDPHILREQRRFDLAKADFLDLCHKCFGGDLTLKLNDADFSIITGGGVQVLDFAVEFFSASRSPRSTEPTRITFAGMSDEILLRPSGDKVRVSANYADSITEVPSEGLAEASRTFMCEVLTDLTMRYPELGRNRHIKKAGTWVGLNIQTPGGPYRNRT
ncbi:hypothetical protein [Streptomyces sp. ECR3]|uniref:hypothetical protein n=1 Tax=Streptomyces sp. ECR3 TaxID=3400630 RepID=UPI003F1C8D61